MLPLNGLQISQKSTNVCFFEKYSGYLEANIEVPLKTP
jgi:hypothetical protein